MKKALIKILCFLPLVVLMLGPVIWVDPLHLFARKHGMNSVPFFDQRLIKTDILRYDHPDYNSILIGSSRVRNMGDISIGDYRFYNYGLGGLMQVSYPGFIKLAHDLAPDSIKCILVGLDMFGASKYYVNTTQWGSTEYYLQKSQSIPYLLRLMITPNSLKYSYKHIYDHFSGSTPNKRHRFRLSGIYYNEMFSCWEFDPELVPLLKQLQQDYQDTRLIFFITPVSVKHLAIMQDNNKVEAFLQWLRILANTVDDYYNFMDITPLTTHEGNWVDGNHADPRLLLELLSSIVLQDEENPNYTHITRQNVENVIKDTRARINGYDLEQWSTDSTTTHNVLSAAQASKKSLAKSNK